MRHVRFVYSKVLKSCLRHRVRFFFVVILVVVYTGYYTASNIGRDTIEEPGQDDSFYVFVYLPKGTKQEVTVKTVENVEDMLIREVPELEHVHAWMREDEAHIRLQLVDVAEREREFDTIREELRPHMQQFAEAEVSFKRSPSRGEDQSPDIDTGQSGIVEIRGPEYQKINTISANFAEVLSMVKDVRDVVSETEAGAYEVHFALDKETGAHLQITPRGVAQSIQVAQREGDFSSIQMEKGDDEVDIIFSQYFEKEDLEAIQGSDNPGLLFEELKDIPVYSPILGGTIPLKDLGRFTIQRGMGSVQRENRERIGRLRFETAPGAKFQEVEQSIQELIKAYPLTAGYRMKLGGKSDQINEEWEAFKLMLWLALLLMYMCIAALFESYSKPIIILLAIPLALVGIVWAFLLTETSFNPLSILGIMFLLGILPNSAILLIHFAGYLRREKSFPRVRAIFVSGQTRLRPIFMTVLTTVLGLLPMAFEWNGDDDWVPFAVPVIGGLLTSTVLTLIIVPGFYFIVEDIANLISRVTRWILSWRWIFVFWSRNQRLRIKEEVTAYRRKPPREEPLRVELDHLTRIYAPSRLDRMASMMSNGFPFGPKQPALGFLPNSVTGSAEATTNSRRKALDTVSLTIDSGLFGLLGPNGAGKTTLLRLIAGIDQPTRGYLSICGYDMKSEAKWAQKCIGYLPQYFGVYSHMTAYQYLDYHALLKGMKHKSKRHSAIMQALEMVNLSSQKNVPVNQFSGGMMRRIGLAQIFVRPPKVLIVDEPTVGLDPMERVRFRNLLMQLSRDRVVILSTHIVEDVAHSCKQMALMNEGCLCYTGTPEALVQTIQNKVWEIVVRTEQEWEEYRRTYTVAGQSHTSEGIRIRIISDYPPTSDAEWLEPTLEDAYLYHMQNK